MPRNYGKERIDITYKNILKQNYEENFYGRMFSFIKNRPPLVIFALCILTLTVTLFSFAFYIKNSGLVLDSDKKYEWTQLLKHFNSLDACIELNIPDTGKPEDNDDTYTEMTMVQTLAKVDVSIMKEFSNVHGFLTLDNWHSLCVKNNPKPKNLNVEFNVPEVQNNITSIDVCVVIKGPEEYLPKFSTPNCDVNNKKRDTKVDGKLSTIINAKYNESFCKGGFKTKLEFYPQEKNNLANFLSDNQKGIIYIHLLWMSYCLVFLLVIILIYGTLQSEYIFDRYLHKFVPFHNQ